MLPASFCRLVDQVAGRRVVALTGAGCSTESGIPDYRGPDGTSSHEPVRYRQFLEDPAARTRYWARSSVGWTRVDRARPNPAHRALARLERTGRSVGVITQNVDGLHQAAGSRRVVELHGSLDRVRCLECGDREPRSSVQRRILDLNPGWGGRTGALPPEGGSRARAATRSGVRAAPDGDAELAADRGGDRASEADLLEGFVVPACRRCGGVLKPDVVFFGESVPRDRVEGAWALFDEARCLLVAGSSLAVWSGFRFVARAGETGLPVVIVNLGETRGDDIARVRVHGRVGRVLPELAGELLRPARG